MYKCQWHPQGTAVAQEIRWQELENETPLRRGHACLVKPGKREENKISTATSECARSSAVVASITVIARAAELNCGLKALFDDISAARCRAHC